MKSRKYYLISLVLLLAIALTGCNPKEEKVSVSGKGTESVDDYPTESIDWVIPFSAGSGADTFARTLIMAVSKELGVEIVPRNVEGGSTSIGVSSVLSKPADGYTLGSNSSSLVSLMASGDAPFANEDVMWLTRINADYKILAVNSDSGITTLDQFIEKASGDNKVKIGGVGVKSWSEIFFKKIVDQTKISSEYIPYDGGSEVVTALLGNHIDAIVATSSNINELVASGDFNLLGVSTTERVENHPDVPTFDELGIKDMKDDLLWRGIFVKPGIPEARLTILVNAFEKALEDPEWKEYMEKQNQLNAFMGYEEFTESVEKEILEYQELLGE